MLVVLALTIWRCPVAELVGLPCPGCGLTRAALALAAGDLTSALRLHPLSPVVMPFGAWLGWRELGRGVHPGEPLGGRFRRGWERLAVVLAGGFTGLLLVVWIARFFGAFGGPVQVSSYLHG